MKIKIKVFLGQKRFQWSGGDANQLIIYIYIYLAGFSKRLSTVTSPMSRVSPPLPNFQVPSSYKNGNCLNIRTSLDILDNIHPRK